MVGAFLGVAFVGWFVEIVAAFALFAAATWIVAALVLVVMLAVYLKVLGQAVRAKQWAYTFDLIFAPLIGTAAGYAAAYLWPLSLDKNVHLNVVEVIGLIALGFHAFAFGPFFVIPQSLAERDDRVVRLAAYASFAACTYVYVTVFVIAGLKLWSRS